MVPAVGHDDQQDTAVDHACSIARSLDVIGDRWSILILRDTFRGIRRFEEIRRDLHIPRAVLADRLTALVDNALLYTDGPVILTASSGPGGELVLHVRDRGPGVLPSEREAIFGRFVRGSAGLASPHRGSGIGLSVVRLLIEAMGGRVQVADHPGGGADFQLVLAGGTNP